MIRALTIDNFKCFQHLELNDLGRINVIGGRNNVGKTALLEAIYLWHNRCGPDLLSNLNQFRRLGHIPLTDCWRPLFGGHDPTRPITMATTQADGVATTLELREQPRLEVLATQADASLLHRQRRPTELVMRSFQEKETRQSVAWWAENERIKWRPLVGDCIPEPVLLLPLTAAVPQAVLAEWFAAVEMSVETSDLAELFSKVFPNSPVRDLAVIQVGTKPTLHVRLADSPTLLPLSATGDGLVRLLSILLAIREMANGALLIDEVEAGFHHSVIAGVWHAVGAYAQRFDCQVFATTHSYECLRAFSEGLPAELRDEARYVRLDPAERGALGKTFPMAFLDASVELNWEIR